MADQENTNNNSAGFRYLMDATNPERQYALEFVTKNIEGKAKTTLKQIHVFNLKNPNDKLAPGEVVYAIHDEREIGNGTVTLDAYKITATTVDSEGQHYRISYNPVTYNAFSSMGQVVFEMDRESEAGMVQPADSIDISGFPLSFNANIASPAAKADIARAGIKALIDAGKVAPPPARPTPQFKKYAQPYSPDKSWKVSDQRLEAALEPYSKNLTALAKAGKLGPVVGRDKEIEASLGVLNRRTQSSLCYTGEPGVGKTVMFDAMAQHLVDNRDNLPEKLQDATVMTLRIGAMVAGARYRGDFEAKLQPIIDGLIERGGLYKGKRLILAIDELPSQLQAGAAEGSAGNAGDMMKDMLTSEGISVIAATTDEEYRKFIEEGDKANARRYEKLRLEEPDKAMTLAIMKKRFELTKRDNNLTEDLSDEMMQYIYKMCNSYAPQEAHPAKDVKVLDTAGSWAELAGRTYITKSDVVAAIAQMSKLPKEFLSQDDRERFQKMEAALSEKVKGQEEALTFITDNLITARVGMKDPKKPWGCFVLQGPPGTGKTQTAKCLAEYLFGDENNMIKLDMGEFMDKYSISRLIGSPPGYVGYSDAPTFAEQVRQKPYSVVLLDEVEKAHPDVLNALLPILNDGRLTDARGNTSLFNNTIILMTSNAGSAEVMKVLEGKDGGIGFGASSDAEAEKKKKKKIAEIYVESIKAKPNGQPGSGSFKPEMISRVKSQGGFVIYNPLSPEIIDQLVSVELGKANDRLNSHDGVGVSNVTLEVSKPIMDELAKEGYTPAMGARELEGVILQKVRNPLSKWLLGHQEELEAFVAENGATKLVIDSLENFEPVYSKVKEPVVVANDDTPAKAPARRRAGGAPSQP